MSKPSQFILSSDYATLKNDGNGSVSVTFPGSMSVAAGNMVYFTNTLQVGRAGASIRARIASSKDNNEWYSCTSLSYARNGTVSGSSAPYSLFAAISRTAPDTVTVVAVVLNPYGSTLTTASGSETFTFRVNTFIPPFDV